MAPGTDTQPFDLMQTVALFQSDKSIFGEKKSQGKLGSDVNMDFLKSNLSNN